MRLGYREPLEILFVNYIPIEQEKIILTHTVANIVGRPWGRGQVCQGAWWQLCMGDGIQQPKLLMGKMSVEKGVSGQACLQLQIDQ